MADLFSPIDEGLKCFIALKSKSKQPLSTDWPNKGTIFTEAYKAGSNVGIILGKASGLLDVDLDCTQAVALADVILPEPYAEFDRGTNDSRHYLYKSNSFGGRKAFNGGMQNSTLVELRGNNHQTMIPPSMHPEGQLLAYTKSNPEAPTVEYDQLRKSVALLAAASELAEFWREGNRHTLALAFSGMCIKEDVEPNLLLHILQRICEFCYDTEVQDRLNAVRTSVHKQSGLAGFSLMQGVIGYEATKRIADRICEYAGSELSTKVSHQTSKQVQILELGQFADRANVTEAKMGIQFSEWLQGKALYVIEAKQWMLWNGRYWEPDLCNSIHNLAFAYVQDVKSTLIERESINDARDLSSFESLNRLHNIASFAATRLPVSASRFNVDQMILATGTDWIDLKTIEAHQPDPNILISKATEVGYLNDAKCPLFEKFIADIFENDAELISFVRKAIGYSLTGSTAEQCMFIMIGDGANGKSTFINIIDQLLGTYGTTAAAQTLVAQGGTSIGDDLVDLAGARLITVSETEEGQSLAEAKIKQMTGGDTLKGRPLYGSYVEFKITGKLWLATNSLPQINNSDHGIWRRIMAIPFNRTFTAQEQDKALQSKLMVELPGILNWALKGCLEWQQEGLNPPSVIEEQVAEYKSSMDSISQFLRDECEVQPDCSYPASQFYSAYRNWCLTVGKKPKTSAAFKRAMESTPSVYQKRTSSGNCWVGIQPCFISV